MTTINTAPNSTSPVFRFVGNLPTTDYGKTLNTEGLTPAGASTVSLISSVAGGKLVYSINGIVNAFTMIANQEYFVSWPVAVTEVLAGPVDDWQGTSQTNAITDLVIKGY